jgi:hypothetical protein
MCEFCLDPNSSNRRNRKSNPDAFHSDFAGFFSAQAIEAAVTQAAAANVAASSSKKRGSNKQVQDGEGNEDDDADSDGT